MLLLLSISSWEGGGGVHLKLNVLALLHDFSFCYNDQMEKFVIKMSHLVEGDLVGAVSINLGKSVAVSKWPSAVNAYLILLLVR